MHACRVMVIDTYRGSLLADPQGWRTFGADHDPERIAQHAEKWYLY
jgi:hypothetical protein